VPQARSLQEWIAGQPATGPRVDVDLDDVVILSSTGGTTGAPKGVMNTHRSTQTFCAHFMIGCPYEADVKPVNLAAARSPIRPACSPCLAPRAAYRGGADQADPAQLLGAIAKHRVTELFLPPTVIYDCWDIPDLRKKADFSSLQVTSCTGAAPMSCREAQARDRGCSARDDGWLRPRPRAPTSILLPDARRALRSGHIAPDERLASVGRPNPLIRVEIMDDANEILPPARRARSASVATS